MGLPSLDSSLISGSTLIHDKYAQSETAFLKTKIVEKSDKPRCYITTSLVYHYHAAYGDE